MRLNRTRLYSSAAALSLFLLCLLVAALLPGASRRARAESPAVTAPTATCPVTHQTFVDGPSHKAFLVDSKRVAFCCGHCPAAFQANPEKYLDASRMGKCPVMGGPDHPDAKDRVVLNNELQYFCCAPCNTAFSTHPEQYRKTLVDVVTNKSFTTAADSPRSDYKGQVYLFANAENKASFDKTPAKYAVVFGPTAQ